MYVYENVYALCTYLSVHVRVRAHVRPRLRLRVPEHGRVHVCVREREKRERESVCILSTAFTLHDLFMRVIYI